MAMDAPQENQNPPTSKKVTPQQMREMAVMRADRTESFRRKMLKAGPDGRSTCSGDPLHRRP
jgi:hypothetical protein